MRTCFTLGLCAVALSVVLSGCGMMNDMAFEMYYRMDKTPPVPTGETIDTLFNVRYTISGKLKQKKVRSQLELDYYVYAILTEAARGRAVAIETNMRSGTDGRKAFAEADLTFTSTDKNKVKEWVKRMLLQGYKVEVAYSRKTKIYTCTAYKK